MSRVPFACAVSHVGRGHDEPAEDEQGSLAAGRIWQLVFMLGKRRFVEDEEMV
jgi:hypothetical protein